MRTVYFSEIKRHIDTLINPNTFWDNIRSFLADKDYSDHAIKRAQAYADQKYLEIKGEWK